MKSIRPSVKAAERGNATYLQYRPLLTEEVRAAERLRTEEAAKRLPLLTRDIRRIANPFFCAVLFGSYAKGRAKKGSDIDLCILHDNEKEAERIISHLAVHPDLSQHPFRYTEFIRMLDSRSFNLAHEIARDGVVLCNTESYYRVLTHGREEITEPKPPASGLFNR